MLFLGDTDKAVVRAFWPRGGEITLTIRRRERARLKK